MWSTANAVLQTHFRLLRPVPAIPFSSILGLEVRVTFLCSQICFKEGSSRARNKLEHPKALSPGLSNLNFKKTNRTSYFDSGRSLIIFELFGCPAGWYPQPDFNLLSMICPYENRCNITQDSPKWIKLGAKGTKSQDLLQLNLRIQFLLTPTYPCTPLLFTP